MSSLEREKDMQFDITQAIEVLSRTPAVFDTLLRDLSDPWLEADEGDETWNPFDVVGHLIHGERTDWIVRAETILRRGESATFEPFDRFAQLEESRGQSMVDLLEEFAALRSANLVTLGEWNLEPADLDRRGRHPEFGVVTLGQLLATWVVHDLGHIGQATRVMAKRYGEDVGPWKLYLPVLGARS